VAIPGSPSLMRPVPAWRRARRRTSTSRADSIGTRLTGSVPYRVNASRAFCTATLTPVLQDRRCPFRLQGWYGWWRRDRPCWGRSWWAPCWAMCSWRRERPIARPLRRDHRRLPSDRRRRPPAPRRAAHRLLEPRGQGRPRPGLPNPARLRRRRPLRRHPRPPRPHLQVLRQRRPRLPHPRRPPHPARQRRRPPPRLPRLPPRHRPPPRRPRPPPRRPPLPRRPPPPPSR
jgi:hypothetical protein